MKLAQPLNLYPARLVARAGFKMPVFRDESEHEVVVPVCRLVVSGGDGMHLHAHQRGGAVGPESQAGFLPDLTAGCGLEVGIFRLHVATRLEPAS